LIVLSAFNRGAPGPFAAERKMSAMKKEFVSIYRPLDEVTANIIKLALEEAGIRAIVRPYHSSWFDGIFVPAEGSWGEVLVPEEDADRAAALLRKHTEVEANHGQEPENEE